MEKKVYLCDIQYYLPNAILSNNQINIEHPEWSADKISKKTGIYNRHISGTDEYASDLGFAAAKKLFEKSKNQKSKIDYLIFCTQSPDYVLPTTACILQERLGLNSNIGAIDINMGCSGYLYGLSYAKGLIASCQAKNVLLITGETYSKYIHSSDKSNKTIFGDGASASLLSNEKNGKYVGEVRNFDFYTDGSGYDRLIVKNSASHKKLLQSADVRNGEGKFISNDDYLQMDGNSIFQFTASKVPDSIQAILLKNDESIEEIDLFIFHQANAFMMNFIRKKCNIPVDKFFVYIEDCGNTVSSTIPIALKEAQRQNRIGIGSKVLLIGYGVGLSIAGTIIHY